jgi:hypothetical protein
MNELIREIEDDIRREKFDRLWQRFGRIMVGVSIVVVLVTIAVVVMQNQKQSQAMELTSEYIRGIDRMNVEDFKGAISVFDSIAANDKSPYYGMALLQKAKAQESLGDKTGAAKTYEQLASQSSAFGELSKLLSASANNSIIEPVKTSPFYYTQSEWKAWQLVGQGKKDDAVAVFMTLREDIEAPSTLRQRVNDALQHLAPQKLLASNKAQQDAAAATAQKGKTNE